MSSTPTAPLVVSAVDLKKTFRRDRKTIVHALDGISLAIHKGSLTAVVGPDGAGKTTLLRLITGLLEADSGTLDVLSINAARHPAAIQKRIGYMPQKFGLYEDLSVQENFDLYADMHGISLVERKERYARLMAMTSLGNFTARLAGKLSGGMKQKLGLACTLVRSPDLLVLDEPTVGVDPLSRQELWEIIRELVEKEKLTVILSTAYLDEAARCHQALVLHEGRVLANGTPESVTSLAAGKTFRTQASNGEPARLVQARLLDNPEIIDAVPDGGTARFIVRNDPPLDFAARPTVPRFEDGFMILLREKITTAPASGEIKLERTLQTRGDDTVVRVNDLVRCFGDFIAVNHVNFSVRRGEIFGLLGPNGAGKTTTFRMLCGLLPATSGEIEVAGVNLRNARAEARQRLGYVAQKFSLYGQLSVLENLNFFASAYGLAGAVKRRRVDWAMHQFELVPLAKLPSEKLPGGFKQRLAMAAALLHEPEMLFLDEPTSGADPLARREFWRRITALAAQGVTVVVTTHFMEEAEYCDRIVIQDAGKVLAHGTPAAVRAQAGLVHGREATMEDAFIGIVQTRRTNLAGEQEVKK